LGQLGSADVFARLSLFKLYLAYGSPDQKRDARTALFALMQSAPDPTARALASLEHARVLVEVDDQPSSALSYLRAEHSALAWARLAQASIKLANADAASRYAGYAFAAHAWDDDPLDQLEIALTELALNGTPAALRKVGMFGSQGWRLMERDSLRSTLSLGLGSGFLERFGLSRA
jgi:hypothetical protein